MPAVLKIFWSQNSLTLLKIIEDPSEFLFIWVVSVDIYQMLRSECLCPPKIHVLKS